MIISYPYFSIISFICALSFLLVSLITLNINRDRRARQLCYFWKRFHHKSQAKSKRVSLWYILANLISEATEAACCYGQAAARSFPRTGYLNYYEHVYSSGGVNYINASFPVRYIHVL